MSGLDIKRDFNFAIRFKQIDSNVINTKITILQDDAIYMKDSHFKNFISYRGTTTNYYIKEQEFHGTRYFNAEYKGQDYKYSVDIIVLICNYSQEKLQYFTDSSLFKFIRI